MINFHIPDFYWYEELNQTLIFLMEKYKDYFYDNVSVGSIYGTFPSAIWNGGRLSIGNCDESHAQSIIKKFNSQGIPVRFTFTNNQLTEEHLSDEYCNRIIELANNGMNGVIINSPILEEYLRDKYPNYKYILSTTVNIRDIDLINKACEKYDCVVLNYNDNKNNEVLENLKYKDKIEILINESCMYNCPNRKRHYDYISKMQLGEDCFKEYFDCPHSHEINIHEIKNKYSQTFITEAELYNNYVKMGFNNFKIQGRELPLYYGIEAYIMYMVKPEYKDFIRFEFYRHINFI